MWNSSISNRQSLSQQQKEDLTIKDTLHLRRNRLWHPTRNLRAQGFIIEQPLRNAQPLITAQPLRTVQTLRNAQRLRIAQVQLLRNASEQLFRENQKLKSQGNVFLFFVVIVFFC